MERRWISVEETAQLLSLSASGVRKKLDRGELPIVRIGRSVRVDMRVLIEQLESQLEGRTTASKTRSAHG